MDSHGLSATGATVPASCPTANVQNHNSKSSSMARASRGSVGSSAGEFLPIFLAHGTVAVYYLHLTQFQRDFIESTGRAVGICPNKVIIYMNEGFMNNSNIAPLLVKSATSSTFFCVFETGHSTPKHRDRPVGDSSELCRIANSMFRLNDSSWWSLVRSGLPLDVRGRRSFMGKGAHWNIGVTRSRVEMTEAEKDEIKGVLRKYTDNVVTDNSSQYAIVARISSVMGGRFPNFWVGRSERISH